MNTPIILLLGICCVVSLHYYLKQRKHIKSLNEQLGWYRRTYLTKKGANTLIPNANPYHLFSPNGGRDWYALGDNGEILGTTEEIYPGLLGQLDGMDTLVDYVLNNGPIGHQGRITSHEMALLKTSGFEVETA